MIKLYNVKTAFLHKKLKEKIFMELPDEIQVSKEQVCKVKKSIYELKQAEKCWHEFLTNVLIRCGLNQFKANQCLF